MDGRGRRECIDASLRDGSVEMGLVARILERARMGEEALRTWRGVGLPWFDVDKTVC